MVACIARNLSTSQHIMFFDPKPVNPWHSKKENVPGIFYRLPRLVNRAASVSSSFPSGPRLGGSPLLRQGRQWPAGACKVTHDPRLFSELERNIIVERIRGGIRRAREQGKRLGRRPFTDPNLLRTVLQIKAQGKSIRAIAEAVKVSKSFVHKTCKNSGSETFEN